MERLMEKAYGWKLRSLEKTHGSTGRTYKPHTGRPRGETASIWSWGDRADNYAVMPPLFKINIWNDGCKTTRFHATKTEGLRCCGGDGGWNWSVCNDTLVVFWTSATSGGDLLIVFAQILISPPETKRQIAPINFTLFVFYAICPFQRGPREAPSYRPDTRASQRGMEGSSTDGCHRVTQPRGWAQPPRRAKNTLCLLALLFYVPSIISLQDLWQ